MKLRIGLVVALGLFVIQSSAEPFNVRQFVSGSVLTGVPPPSGGGPACGVNGLVCTYVATTGSDSNSCTTAHTISTPRRNIASTLASCGTAGQWIVVRAGTYNEGINSNSITIPVGSSWASPVTIIAATGETVVVTGGLNLAASYIQYLVFDGINWDGQLTYNGLSFQDGANHIRVTNAEVHNIYGQAIQGGFNASVPTHHIELINLAVHDNGYPTVISEPPPVGPGGSGGRYDHGLYMTVPDLLIERCNFYANSGNGIQIYWEGGANANNTIIRNNRIHDNLGDVNVTLNYGDNIQFYNNIVYNASSGVHVRYSVPNPRIYNNTIYGHTGGYGIYIGSEATNGIFRNNLVYNNGTPFQNDGSGTTASNNLSTNPSFVNAGTGDFHLQLGSLSIDTGFTVSAVTTDFDGVTRPQGSAYDVGAYER